MPVVLAALGDRMLEIAGREAAGTILWMTGFGAIERYVVPQLRAAAALSVALQERKQFSREAYHQRHPAGALGRRSDSGD